MPQVKHVKFTPEEMAYEAPKVVNFKQGLVIKGTAAWKKYLTAKQGYARLAPELRRAFPDDRSVNAALRSIVKVKDNGTHRRRKSA